MKEKGKAAILTWCYNNGKTNYGQILQCFAMQEVISQLGYDPVVVRYRRPDSDENVYGLPKSERDRYEYDYRIRVVEGKKDKRIERFMSFIRENIELSEQCYTKAEVEEVTADCEVLVCGSDQIWNPLWFDDIYALNFGSPGQRRIAYAPSGVLDESSTQATLIYKEIAEYIERFEFVTLREKKGVEILKKYSNKIISDAIDPTMLVTQDRWDEVSALPVSTERYVFCYSLGRMRPHKILLRYFMKRYRADKVFFITSGHYDEEDELETDDVFKAVTDAGPAEFISLIKNAVAVCTDSFHGIAMSAIYRKQFYVICRNDPNISVWASMERQMNLLDKLGMKDGRIVRSIADAESMADINYKEITLKTALPEF